MAIQPELHQWAAGDLNPPHADSPLIDRILVLGISFIVLDYITLYNDMFDHRSPCKTWNAKRITAKNRMEKAASFAIRTHEEYQALAKRSCNEHYYHFQNKSSCCEIQIYCDGENYPTDKIPSFWSVPLPQIKNTCGDLSSRRETLDKDLASQLSSLAKRALKAQARFENKKLNLSKVGAKRPHLTFFHRCPIRNKYQPHR